MATDPSAAPRALSAPARWLLLGLEFMLAADIVRSAIAPDWNDIGQLAAIAVIRTFLNYFLERDLADMEERQAAGAGKDVAPETQTQGVRHELFT